MYAAEVLETMETKMNHPPNEGNISAEADASQESTVAGSNRRRFTRNAVVGSAVLFSLGNRAAWGADPTCLSATFLASFSNVAFSASPVGSDRYLDELKAETILAPGNDGERYTDEDGNTCVP